MSKKDKKEQKEQIGNDENVEIRQGEYGTITETKEPVKVGRKKLTDDEREEKYQSYVKKIESRNLLIEKENKEIQKENEKNPDSPKELIKLLKTLDKEKWLKGMPSGESSNEIFIRLMKKRVPKVLTAIKALKNLSTYQHSEKNTEKLLMDLNSAVDFVQIAFEAKGNKETEELEYEVE